MMSDQEEEIGGIQLDGSPEDMLRLIACEEIMDEHVARAVSLYRQMEAEGHPDPRLGLLRVMGEAISGLGVASWHGDDDARDTLVTGYLIAMLKLVMNEIVSQETKGGGIA